MQSPGREYHAFDAESVDDAVRLFVKKENAEIIGTILTFPGFQDRADARGGCHDWRVNALVGFWGTWIHPTS